MIEREHNESFSSLRSKDCVRVNSFHQDNQKRESDNLSAYLHSEEQESRHQSLNDDQTEQKYGQQLMKMDEKYYLLSPQLYESFRNQKCLHQTQGDHFNLFKYSKGRIEMEFPDCIQISLPENVSLTVYRNGDYKLINNDFAYFWCEEEKMLQKYSITL